MMPRYADPLTQAIQRLNSNPYNLDKDECIQVIRELRDELRAELRSDPIAWVVYCGLPPTRKKSVHFERHDAVEAASRIKSATEVRPLYEVSQPPVQHQEGA